VSGRRPPDPDTERRARDRQICARLTVVPAFSVLTEGTTPVIGACAWALAGRREESPLVGHTLECVHAAIGEGEARAGDEVLDRLSAMKRGGVSADR